MTLKKIQDLKLMYFIGGIDVSLPKIFNTRNANLPSLICQYHHPLAWMKDVTPSMFLPTKTFVEEPGTYVNMQGRVQEGKRVIAKQAGEGHELSGQSILDELVSSTTNNTTTTTQPAIDISTDNTFYGVTPNITLQKTYNNVSSIRKTLMKNVMHDAYSSDPVSKSSVILSEASRLRRKRGTNYEFAF